MLNPTLQGHTSTHSHMQPAGLFSLAEENLDVEETSCFLMSQRVNENSLNLDLKGFFHSFGSLLERKKSPESPQRKLNYLPPVNIWIHNPFKLFFKSAGWKWKRRRRPTAAATLCEAQFAPCGPVLLWQTQHWQWAERPLVAAMARGLMVYLVPHWHWPWKSIRWHHTLLHKQVRVHMHVCTQTHTDTEAEILCSLFWSMGQTFWEWHTNRAVTQPWNSSDIST